MGGTGGMGGMGAAGGDLAGRVLAAMPRAGGTRVIALDGPSGSGKTTLARDLAEALRDDGALRTDEGRRNDAALRVGVLHLDDLYPGWDGLAATVPLLTRGVLEPVAAGRPGGYHRWDWHADAPGAHVEVPVVDVLIVEGAGAGARAVAPYLSMLVWVEADEATRRTRALARDGETYRPHWHRWADQERRHFAAEDTRARADVQLHT